MLRRGLALQSISIYFPTNPPIWYRTFYSSGYYVNLVSFIPGNSLDPIEVLQLGLSYFGISHSLCVDSLWSKCLLLSSAVRSIIFRPRLDGSQILVIDPLHVGPACTWYIGRWLQTNCQSWHDYLINGHTVHVSIKYCRLVQCLRKCHLIF